MREIIYCEDCQTRGYCNETRTCKHAPEQEEDDAPTGRWMICPICDGEGKHSRRFGAMTMSEFEDCFDDEESRQDYFDGAYDQRCNVCEGSGKIRDTDEMRARIDRENEQELIDSTGRNSMGEPCW